ncbi:MAG TPA: ABC transporter permease, partial [Vicinamibacterales bacterium]|nr:ABC transporter permease [Vicinamibacterales bacterium]
VTRYLARRLLTAIPVLLGVTLVTFLLMHAAAGEIVPGLNYSPDLRPDDIERLRRSLGLDRPILLQYLTWLGGVVRGDFGVSMLNSVPVTDAIAARLPNTLLLTTTALVLGVTISIPFGIISAVRRGKTADNALTVLSVLGFSIPAFWLGLVLILVFAIQFRTWGLPALPTGGAETPILGGDLLDRVTHLLLPATVLAFFYISVWSRFVRSSMLEVLGREYVLVARAKGLRRTSVLVGHALRNALIPLVTLLGAELPGLVSGGLVVEVVFSWPGVGLFAYQRALAYDYTTVMGTTTFAALMVVAGSLIADVLYVVVDPRIRYS